MPLYIGLMSGTSIDAVDAVLAFVDDHATNVIARHEHAITSALHDAIREALNTDSLSATAYWRLDAQLGELFADAALELIARERIDKTSITAIASHGQTIFHAPDSKPPLSVQAGDANIIAARTGITTVADFRRRDIALGGQGAPLAPAFHRAVFSSADETRAIVNIGGIANISVLSPRLNDPVLGFDSGPGNTLMDLWCQRHLQQPFDHDGRWAARGTVDPVLLTRLNNDDYFHRPPPKSTGREHFNLSWLERHLAALPTPPDAIDVQSTLLELTAQSITDAIDTLEQPVDAVYLCGGGALNAHLRQSLHRLLGNVRMDTTQALGIHPKDVEGAAFAWLAHRSLNTMTGNAPSVTGARSASVLGAIYPGATVTSIKC